MFDSKKFETQVQEKLHGMDLSPSPAVWDKIEGQLPPENRRWGSMAFWGTLLVAAMSAGGYFFFINTKTVSDKANTTLSVNTPVNSLNNNTLNPNKTSGSDNIIHAESKTNDGRNQLQPAAGNQPAAAGEAVKGASVGAAAPVKTAVSTHPSVLNNAGSFHKQPVSGRIAGPDNAGASKATTGLNRSDVSGATFIDNQDIAGYKRSSGRNNIKKRGIAHKAADSDASGSGATDVLEDRLAGRQPVKEGTSSDVLQEDVALRPAVVNGALAYHPDFRVYAAVKNLEKTAAVTASLRNNKKWSFELGVSGGQSIYSAGKVKKLFTAADPAVLNSISTTRPPSSPNYSFYPTAAYVPSEVKPGKSLSAGLDARYKITKRVSISGGVYYTLLTTNIQTGRKFNKEKNIDVNGQQRQVREFYAAGYSNDYTNSYHFIELPVLLRLQLNHGRKLPLYLNGGLSYSRLFNTNALHYDATAGIYYRASELVKKDFLNVEGGLSAKLFSSKWYSFVIGPEIQYGLTNLFKENIQQQNKHSLFLGIKASVPLNF